jgi:hypothetical protein
MCALFWKFREREGYFCFFDDICSSYAWTVRGQARVLICCHPDAHAIIINQLAHYEHKTFLPGARIRQRNKGPHACKNILAICRY